MAAGTDDFENAAAIETFNAAIKALHILVVSRRAAATSRSITIAITEDLR
jgi:hypothetical protein